MTLSRKTDSQTQTTASTDSATAAPGDVPQFEPYESPAGGWGALQATAKALREQSILIKGGVMLHSMNQPDGFDCPGCAWPDPKHTSSFEFCENGAKALAFEATNRRVTPEFFATHTVRELEQRSDYWLEEQGRLTEPMRYDATSDHYVSDTSFERWRVQIRPNSTPPAARRTKLLFFTSFSFGGLEQTTFQTARTCVTSRQVSACLRALALARAP
jgi:hypothetical protein